MNHFKCLSLLLRLYAWPQKLLKRNVSLIRSCMTLRPHDSSLGRICAQGFRTLLLPSCLDQKAKVANQRNKVKAGTMQLIVGEATSGKLGLEATTPEARSAQRAARLLMCKSQFPFVWQCGTLASVTRNGARELS